MNTDILIGYLICMAMYEIIRPFCGKLWDCCKRLHGWRRKRKITFPTYGVRVNFPPALTQHAITMEHELFPRVQGHWYGDVYDPHRNRIEWNWPRVPGCAR